MTMALIFMMLAAGAPGDLGEARDAQDRAALEKLAHSMAAAADGKTHDARAQYLAALAFSYWAEVEAELRDKRKSAAAAERGIGFAQKATALDGKNAEHHRLLGALCGQVIPANILAGMKYGQCALDEINRAIGLDGRSAMAHLSKGVGNYYLPPAFGGGVEAALESIGKALALDPKLADAHLWHGVALRKAGQNAKARKAFERSLQLNPARVWARQQLEKTPAQ